MTVKAKNMSEYAESFEVISGTDYQVTRRLNKLREEKIVDIKGLYAYWNGSINIITVVVELRPR